MKEKTKKMNELIIEVRRPPTAEKDSFAKSLFEYILTSSNMATCTCIETFDTVAERTQVMHPDASQTNLHRFLTVDISNNFTMSANIIDADIDTENDLYYVTMRIPAEYMEFMSNTGKLLPRCIGSPHTDFADTPIENEDGKEEFLIARIICLDYVRKGGQ